MKDFRCCGEVLPTLHDLLQHYEECHAQPNPQSLRTAAQHNRESQQPNSKAAIAAQAATSVQQQTQQQQARQQQQQAGRPQNGMKLGLGGQGISSLSGGIQQMRQQQNSQPSTPTQQKPHPLDDMDGVEDMEIDDPVGPMDPVDTTPNPGNPQGGQQQQMFGQRPSINLSNTNGMIHQGLRTSQPTTPSATNFGFQNNPTVSSVNTPTLSAQPMQGQGTFSPDTSVPGTPAEMDDDFNGMNLKTLNNMGNMAFPFGLNNDLGVEMCIDEPAKRLYSPNGGFGNNNNNRALQQQFAAFGLGNNPNSSNTDEIMRRYQNQQLLQMRGMSNIGNSAVAMMMAAEEHKPFRCPVIGCEKAYKNQNGLK